jgi:hypothetical protein
VHAAEAMDANILINNITYNEQNSFFTILIICF